MRSRGMGTVYQRGTVWWVKYYRNGKEHRESTRSPRRGDAQALLKKRIAEIHTGTFSGATAERVTFEELAQLMRDDYRVNGRRSLDRAEQSITHLKGVFGLDRARSITASRIMAYVISRKEAGAASATIKSEVGALRRMFNLGIQLGLVSQKPVFPMIQVHNARTGFFEEPEFRKVLVALPTYLKGPMEFGYITGWRVQSEVLRLTWGQVDFNSGTVRLEPGSTKNREGRSFPFALHPRLNQLLREQRKHTDAVERREGRIIPQVFHRNGKPLESYKDGWKAALKRAGCPGKLVHDLRRTAVRNLVRAGIPEHTAMKLTGHLTRSVFDRYDIVSDGDLRDAVAKLAKHRPAGAATPEATVSPLSTGTGTV